MIWDLVMVLKKQKNRTVFCHIVVIAMDTVSFLNRYNIYIGHGIYKALWRFKTVNL